ncbi:uncharacterized protein AB675_3335 [Cyphellophora attinorum]|uniref:RING-type domain-containing protein n=1 Tax=Cyphellophora attinorum TaxID=1664694 RepID=A0A0N0NM06_9EURO|nr:uncharacterized protein AB675_3335 [Phialophora attinorum]KPI39649.1 hypothetical protein AB675_3335 [Phialophora attinorum]
MPSAARRQPLWDPAEVLKVFPGECNGITKRGTPCGQRFIRGSDIQQANKILDNLSYEDPRRKVSSSTLEDLAFFTLCPRWHQKPSHSQVLSLANKWEIILRDYRTGLEPDEIVTSRQHALSDTAQTHTTYATLALAVQAPAAVQPLVESNHNQALSVSATQTSPNDSSHNLAAAPTPANQPTRHDPVVQERSTNVDTQAVLAALDVLRNYLAATTPATATSTSLSTAFQTTATAEAPSSPQTSSVTPHPAISTVVTASDAPLHDNLQSSVNTPALPTSTSVSVADVLSQALGALAIIPHGDATDAQATVNQPQLDQPAAAILQDSLEAQLSEEHQSNPSSPTVASDLASTEPATSTSPEPALAQAYVPHRRPLHECPICLDDFSAPEEEDPVVFCRAQCGQNFHKGCMTHWLLDSQERAREEIGPSIATPSMLRAAVMCPFCRTQWRWSDEDD